MKLTSVLLISSLALAQTVALAQTAPPAKPHVAVRPTTAVPACVKTPTLSPKIPALPAGAPCAKTMYTLTTSPAAKTSDATPAIAASVREYFGLDPVSFSLAYVDTKIGTGELAQPHKWYSVIYTGYLQDGTVFDSSAKHPEMGSFVLQQGTHKVIPGWDTGFYGMHVGGKRRLFIPHQLAYGPRGSGAAIPPNADLVFDIELVSQSDQDPTPPKTPPAPPAAAAPKPPTPATPLTPAAAPLTTAAPPPAGQPASAPAPPAPAPAATAPKPQ